MSLSDLADDGLPVAAGHVVELDPVVVEVVQDGQTDLVALPIVRLGPAGAPRVGPGEAGEGPTGRPRHVSAPHAAACPEKSLVLSLDQSQELALFGRAVDTDWSAKLDGQLIAST